MAKRTKTVAVTLTKQDNGVHFCAGRVQYFFTNDESIEELAKAIDDPTVMRAGPQRPADFLDTIADGIRGMMNGDDGNEDDDVDCSTVDGDGSTPDDA